MGEEENKAIARMFYEEVENRGNLSVIDKVTAENYVDHTAARGARDRVKSPAPFRFVAPVSRFPALAFYGPAVFLRTWSSLPSRSTRSSGKRRRSSERRRSASRRSCWSPRMLAPGASGRHGS